MGTDSVKGHLQGGIRGYRLHWKKASGKPDISFPGRKVAIFMHGCYWHRCPHCKHSMPKHNADFWQAKFARNIERDLQNGQELTDANWKVLQLWECEVKKDIVACVERVREIIC